MHKRQTYTSRDTRPTRRVKKPRSCESSWGFFNTKILTTLKNDAMPIPGEIYERKQECELNQNDTRCRWRKRKEKWMRKVKGRAVSRFGSAAVSACIHTFDPPPLIPIFPCSHQTTGHDSIITLYKSSCPEFDKVLHYCMLVFGWLSKEANVKVVYIYS